MSRWVWVVGVVYYALFLLADGGQSHMDSVMLTGFAVGCLIFAWATVTTVRTITMLVRARRM